MNKQKLTTYDLMTIKPLSIEEVNKEEEEFNEYVRNKFKGVFG